jgi:hypothetical protein
MQDFLSQGWVGSLIGIIGVILAIIFYFKQNKKKILACESASLGLIAREEQQLPQNVKITFDDIPLNQLTLTQLWLWNNGDETIDGNQIVSNDPIKYIFDDETKILSASIISVTREVNNANIISIMENQIELCFDYFDKNDGIKIEILHTGKPQNPKITGTIKGMPHGIKKFIYPTIATKLSLFEENDTNKKFNYFTMGIGCLISIIGFLPDSIFIYIQSLMKNINDTTASSTNARITFIAIGLTYLFLPLFMKLAKRKKHPEILDANHKSLRSQNLLDRLF